MIPETKSKKCKKEGGGGIEGGRERETEKRKLNRVALGS